MRARGILFAVAVAFSVWNVMNQGLNVQSGAICLMVLVCLALNVYNYRQKQAQTEAAEREIRAKEEIRQMRAEARRKQNRKNRKHKK